MILTMLALQALSISPPNAAAPRQAQPVMVYQWDKAPTRADLAGAFPSERPDIVSSFGSIDCTLGVDRRPKDCRPGFGPDPSLSQAMVALADKFQGPPSNIPAGASINIVMIYQPASQIVGPPRFVEGPDDLQGKVSDWALKPTLRRIAEIAPSKLAGANSGVVECRVTAGGRLDDCHIFTPLNAPRPRCYHGGAAGDVCSPEDLERMKPAPELAVLAQAVRAPIKDLDGRPSLGRTVRFFATLMPAMAPPLQIAPPPPPLLPPLKRPRGGPRPPVFRPFHIS